jgi:hypothetical protein
VRDVGHVADSLLQFDEGVMNRNDVGRVFFVHGFGSAIVRSSLTRALKWADQQTGHGSNSSGAVQREQK